MAKLTLAAVESLIAKQTVAFTNEIKTLREEVSSLRSELVAVTAALETTKNCVTQFTGTVPNTDSDHADAATSDSGSKSAAPSFSDVVSASVKTAFREEKSKSEVVIVQFPEKKKDTEELDALCSKICIPARPTAIMRMGRKETAKSPRPMKLTFGSPFDARAFMARVSECKKNGDAEVKDIRCRPCRSPDEQKRYVVLSAQVHKLNQEALATSEETASYSLRNNGEVWKFTQDESSKWKRVTDWTFTPSSSQESGNEEGEPEA